MLQVRALLEIDQIEARAIQKRTACTTLSDLCEMMTQYVNRDKVENKFLVILGAALVNKRKTEQVYENLKAICEFESKIHMECYDAVFQIERKGLEGKKKQISDIQMDNNSQDLAFSYLPFWDSRIMIDQNSSEEQKKKLQEKFNLSPPEAYNLCRLINSYTLREFLKYYRANQSLYSPSELRELSVKGLQELRITQFTKLIVFLSAQWLSFPTEISDILQMKFQKIKFDLSRVELNSAEALNSLIKTFYNCKHTIKRFDIS